jgi:hypothetical protein
MITRDRLDRPRPDSLREAETVLLEQVKERVRIQNVLVGVDSFVARAKSRLEVKCRPRYVLDAIVSPLKVLPDVVQNASQNQFIQRITHQYLPIFGMLVSPAVWFNAAEEKLG